MESAPPIPIAPDVPTTTLSPFERLVFVFARPAQAWSGLESRAQWWFPLLLMLTMNIAFAAVLHDRAIVPMVTAKWDDMVESGQMTPEAAEKARASLDQPVMRTVMVAQQAIMWPIMMLVTALGVWASVSFMLGSKLTFRQAFEVATWSSLVLIPGTILTGVIAWTRGTLQDVHLGLAALLPDTSSPGRLMAGVIAFLDALGPFSIWWLVVAILGASALSRAPRPAVARVMVIVYLVFALCAAGLAAMFASGRSA
jgi:hypothetical protein